jgi:exosortase/archaeosortase family protein
VEDLALPVGPSGRCHAAASRRLQQSAGSRSGLLAGLAVVAVGLAAYRFTLWSLAADLRLDTPLAYLPLIPLFSAYLAVDAVRRQRGEAPPAREGAIDALVGLPLMIVALLLVTALPVISSTYYWSDRPDVLSLALFLIGATTLCFGLGWVWRLRWAFVFLLLMWPGLYLHALTGVLSGFSSSTNGVLNILVRHLPLGAHLGGTSGLLVVQQAGSGIPLQISVSSACAGSDTGLGFALVGGAVLVTRRGAVWRRVLWLGVGLLAAFALNVARIASILLIARHGSARFALEGYHATVGLVAFTVLLITMVVLLPRFGLHLPDAAGAASPARETKLVRGQTTSTAPHRAGRLGVVPAALDGSETRPAPSPTARRAALAKRIDAPPPVERPSGSAGHVSLSGAAAVVAARVRRDRTAELGTRPALAANAAAAGPVGPRRGRWWVRPLTVALLALVCGVADSQLGPYAAFADGAGAPRVQAFSSGQLPTGWSAEAVATYPWAGQYFGGGTNWTRYLLSSTSGGAVTADVVITPDRSAFDAYGVQSCFLFHRYQVLTHDRADLGAGVTGLSLDYSTAANRWATVSWAWPVLVSGRTEYERVLLTVPAGTTLRTAAPPLSTPVRSTGLMSRVVLRITDTVTSHRAAAPAPTEYRSANAGLLGVARGLVGTAVAGAAS